MNILSKLARYKWLAALLAMSAAVGSACAFFLWSLDAVTSVRFDHPWLLWLLPFAGMGIGALYQRLGGRADAGNNLIIDEIHEPGGGVPRRMAPLILLCTLVTHLFGGSAGREGTAVQMGGSIAGAACKAFRTAPEHVRLMLMGGVAAGFGAVFGTPLAGAIFAMEVLTVGRLKYSAALPCLLAAVAADFTCHAWGIGHTRYIVSFRPSGVDFWLLAKVVMASVLFGLASRGFAGLSHAAAAMFKKRIERAWLRPFVGGLMVIALFFLAGRADYLGLGVWSRDANAITIPSFFTSAEVHPWSWLWKTVFTVVTLSSGFKGGEVTPLFFIGAALGNALSAMLGAPPDLFAALGFVAIFAGATNTPLACTIMGIELFGAANAVYLAIACFVAFFASGKTGIYSAQRIAIAGEEKLRRLR